MNTGRCKYPKLLPQPRSRTWLGHPSPKVSSFSFPSGSSLLPQATDNPISVTINYFSFSRISYDAYIVPSFVSDFFHLA